MEKLKFISFIVLCLLGINRIAYSQEQDTVIIKDSIAKMKLDKKLIKLAKQVVLKHGPEYYREYREPVIRYRRVSKAWNDLYPEFIEAYAGQVFYTVEYPYNEEEERFYTDYSAKVYFHEDLTIFHASATAWALRITTSYPVRKKTRFVSRTYSVDRVNGCATPSGTITATSLKL